MKIVKVKVAPKNEKEIFITGDSIKLDAALKLSSAVSTGGQAKMVIQDGLVKVNGNLCEMRGKKLSEGDNFEYNRVIYIVRKS